MKKHLIAAIIGSTLMLPVAANAADYVIDTQGAHASIQFSVNHLGYSFVVGRFNEFSGDFSFDANKLADAKLNVKINTNSVDSNHAERDKHLRSEDFLNTSKFSQATFTSTSIVDKGNNQFVINGDFTLNGVTKPLTIDAVAIGEGKDPWGGYRAGFSGTTTFAMKDFDVKMDLGPASANVELALVVEGIKQ
ncbi:YceI family protein [Shewanella psychromarinicola]|uniref:YceI family protein n=1 Tax=Shewanella psychromarinicola TaxID=2487742 RepID=A0A3N4E774_9GAMM|nr:YceI family protein [Shewanella psychromarinicola]AZG35320.1 YceI family protein [Shewanella psychromarinicola]MCL1081575.1 YceI family protein [Shewanella psychromarinicola]RPA32876.1 YceI family protein [Shewanella psychromarinicola]